MTTHEIAVAICETNVRVRSSSRYLHELALPSFAEHPLKAEPSFDDLVLELEEAEDSGADPPILERDERGISYRDKFANTRLEGAHGRSQFYRAVWEREDANYINFFYTVIRPMLLEGMWQRRRWFVHAAAIHHQRHGGLLVIGDSRHGKSSIAAAHLEAGHELVTDDLLFFHRTGPHIRLGGLQRRLHLSPDLGGKLPSLAGIDRLDRDAGAGTKVTVSGKAIYGDQMLTGFEDVRLVLFPQIVNEPTTSVTPLSHPEAMRAFLENAYTGLHDPDAGLTTEMLRAVLHIIRSSRAFAVRCGHDTHRDPARYVDLLDAACGAH